MTAARKSERLSIRGEYLSDFAPGGTGKESTEDLPIVWKKGVGFDVRAVFGENPTPKKSFREGITQMAKEEEKKEKKPGIDFGVGNTLKGIFDGISDLVDSMTSLVLGKKEKKEKDTTKKRENKN